MSTIDKKAAGPNYLSLINEAIAAKKSRTGVSRQAISKYIEEVHPSIFASPAFKRSFRSALKRGVDKQMITAVSASTYKNTDKAKKELIAAAKPKKVTSAPAPVAAPVKKATTSRSAAPVKSAAKPSAKPVAKAAAKPVAKAKAAPKKNTAAAKPKPKAKVSAKRK